MKLILAGDTALYTAADYSQFIYNCNLSKCQINYAVPIPSFDRQQYFVFFGSVKPTAISIDLINTCTPGDTIPVTVYDYVVGQLPNGQWYGVFKNFVAPEGASECFVLTFYLIFADLTELRYFTEEICIEDCNVLMEVRACYPENQTTLGFDINLIYFGYHTGTSDDALGDISIRYYHRLYIRQAEIINTAHKTSLKTWYSRNFRTEIQKIFEFRCEFLPEWYKNYIMAVMARGVITVRRQPGGLLEKFTLSETNFELIDEDARLWKPITTLIEVIRNFFGCDDGMCAPACILPPNTFAISGNVVTLTGGYFNTTGDMLYWELYQRVYITSATDTLISSGTLIATPLSLDFSSVTGFDTATKCYYLKWRKRCKDIDNGSFSEDYSDDFDTGTNQPRYTEWVGQQFGTCIAVAPPLVYYYYNTLMYQCGATGNVPNSLIVKCASNSLILGKYYKLMPDQQLNAVLVNSAAANPGYDVPKISPIPYDTVPLACARNCVSYILKDTSTGGVNGTEIIYYTCAGYITSAFITGGSSVQICTDGSGYRIEIGNAIELSSGVC